MSIVLEVTPLIKIGSCDELYCDLSSFLEDGSFLSKLEWIKSLWSMVCYLQKRNRNADWLLLLDRSRP